MLTRLSRGAEKDRTRWDLMRERAAGFVDRLPDGAQAWAIIFNAEDPSSKGRPWFKILGSKLETPADRSNLSSVIKTYPEPAQANGTWLRQAVDKALDQVELEGARNPDAYLTVMVYTDGVDEGHGKSRAEIAQNRGSQVTKGHLDARIQKLRERFRNFNLIDVYRPGDESILDAHVVRLTTNRLQLANPRVYPKQQLELEFAYRDSPTLNLTGRPLGLSIVGSDGAAVPLKLTGSPFKLAPGKLVVGVEPQGEWPAGRDVKVFLKVDYPRVEGSFLVAEGGNSVDLLIQGAEAPSIRDLQPASGSVQPVGKDVTFSLTTLPGVDVEWNFGEGKIARGNPVMQSFSVPGKRNVTVTVTDPRTKLSSSATTPIELARNEVRLDPAPGPFIPDKPYTFSASAEGDFQRFIWSVDGRQYVGAPRQDGRPGTTLSLQFERAGTQRITVMGETRQGSMVEAPTLSIEVKPVPALRLTSPAARDVLYFGSTRELRAEVEGLKAQRVRFSLTGANGEPILPAKEVDVALQGTISVAVVAERIPTLKGRVAAVLRAEVPDAQPPLVREVPVVLEREVTTLEVTFPEGREPFINRSTSVQARANAAITELRWDFGDGAGTVAGAEVERYTWKRYGDFTVKALAKDADGNPVESAAVQIKVPVRPVAVKPKLIYEGQMVGRDTDRVPVNATLKLDAGAEGDVVQVRWYLDEKELAGNQETLIVDTRGKHRLRVVAEGTAEAGSAESVIEFHTGDPVLFWSLAGALGFLTALLGWLLLGNKWRFAEFQVRTDGAKWDERDAFGGIQPDAAPRRLGAGTAEEICGRWNFFTKRATVSIKSLDNRIEHQLGNTRYVPCSFRWKDDDSFLLAGVDKPPVLRGALNGRVTINTKARRDRLNPAKPKPTDWLVCWALERSGMPSRRPSGIEPGPSFETMAIYLRLRPRGGGYRYWLETVFVVQVVAVLATCAWLFKTLY